MDLPLNHNEPTIMHIDLNSCFATVEQQAYPSLRGKPIVIAAYTTPGGCVLAPSIEAKRYGVKTGMTVRDARLLCRDIIVRDPDPQMINQVHLRFRDVLRNYSPYVIPKSIDELVIDFSGTLALKRGLIDIALEIKKDIQKQVGEWIKCNIGISTNRFLAKLAASLHKPDGLDVIDNKNLKDIYAARVLMDLNGINTRFQARLNAAGIFTPLEFLASSVDMLQHQVFKSICGYYWYKRLRGWEVDAVEFARKSYGQSYALKQQTNDPKIIFQLLMKLCEKMGRRLRRNGYYVSGVHVACVYTDLSYWHMGKTFQRSLYTTPDLYTKAIWILNQQPEWKKVRELAVSCYHFVSTKQEQQVLFETGYEKRIKVQKAVDCINDKWGEYVMTPARMMGMDDVIIERIAYGGTKELEDIYLN